MTRLARRRATTASPNSAMSQPNQTPQRPLGSGTAARPARQSPPRPHVTSRAAFLVRFVVVALVLTCIAIPAIWWFKHDPFEQVASDREAMLEAWSTCDEAFAPIHSSLASYHGAENQHQMLLDAAKRFRTDAPAFSEALVEYRRAGLRFRRTCNRAAIRYERLAAAHNEDETLTLAAKEVQLEGARIGEHAELVSEVWQEIENRLTPLRIVATAIEGGDGATNPQARWSVLRRRPGGTYHHPDLSGMFRSFSAVAEDVRRLRAILAFEQ